MILESYLHITFLQTELIKDELNEEFRFVKIGKQYTIYITRTAFPIRHAKSQVFPHNRNL